MEIIEKISLKILLENNSVIYLEHSEEKNVKEDEVVLTFKNETPNIVANLSIKNINEAIVGKLSFDVESPHFREKNNLSTMTPIKISMVLSDNPKRILANYLHRDWWTRPSFTENTKDIPSRTQSLLIENENNFTYILPLVGDKFKTEIEGSSIEERCIDFVMTGYTAGVSSIDDLSFIITRNSLPFLAINNAFDIACCEKNIPRKEEKEYKEMFEYLGWCSWDAFYSDVDEEKLRAKVLELKEKSVPIKWMLIDDGWLNQENQKLKSFSPDKVKFPNAFKNLVSDIKLDLDVNWVGVWHAFGGYWGGIMENSEIYNELLYKTHSGQVIPPFEKEKAFQFWDSFYKYLSSQGIDFVKVDGQSALKNYYGNNELIGEVAKGAHSGFEKAVFENFDGNLINCMGMASENLFNRKTGVSRNSDDFVPDDENGFIEHLLQNVYNSLYHDNLYYCDWDMFWTNHVDAIKHAVLRAISGGPIYFSDKLGITDINTIMPLIYSDGKILRMDRGAMPTLDCIFENPENSNFIKITNKSNDSGYILIYNFDKDSNIDVEVSIRDIHDLNQNCVAYLVYDYFNESYKNASIDDSFKVNIEKSSFVWLQVVPKLNDLTVIGLKNKYISSHAIKKAGYGDDFATIELIESGTFTFTCEKSIKSIMVQGIDLTEKLIKKEKLYSINLEEYKECLKVEIYF